ncbi:hypothetical protein MKK63_16930 [Methylobacterium sp. J-088]|uniref:hypothetical protein n=1 Tax=Methylobacterium sp. J-088 TaxID=2836664 RepID=UPI001FBB45A9|nr:hypothetical protein [Methylobacterium sp. J-088]MCJ2064386.1 hypothetical protein [Methylobacterium sp. J-088]
MADRGNVETLVVLQPISVDTASPDRVGMLVIVSGLLVAVLVRLDAPWHERPGAWHMEAGLGRLAGVRAPVFDTLEDATRWVRQRLRK